MDPGHLLFKDNREPKGTFATATLDATKIIPLCGWETAQSIKGLLFEHEDPSSNPSHPHKNWQCTRVHDSNPSTEGGDRRDQPASPGC